MKNVTRIDHIEREVGHACPQRLRIILTISDMTPAASELSEGRAKEVILTELDLNVLEEAYRRGAERAKQLCDEVSKSKKTRP